jgi:hypothetical protein
MRGLSPPPTAGCRFEGCIIAAWPAMICAMTDRPFRAVDELIRRVQRVAAGKPDMTYILAQMISMIGVTEVDPYAVLGVLIEGAVHTLTQHIPAERRVEAVAMLMELLEERLKAHGLTGGGG